MNKKNIVLIGIVLIIAGICFCMNLLSMQKGYSVEVIVNGKLSQTYSLQDNQKVVLNGYQNGINELVIQNRRVYISNADCKDKLCVHHKPIQNVGESIVCLPHRLVIQIGKGA